MPCLQKKKLRVYKGMDREPLVYTPHHFHEYTQERAIQYFDLISRRDAELIFVRVAGCDDEIPNGFTFLGYDAAWVLGFCICDAFSAICDCMFLCHWHGCDNEGTEFLPEFQQLNSNGLFNSETEAAKYLIHYLSQDWSAQGEYCIYEVYGRI